MKQSNPQQAEFERDGRVWLRNAISESDLASFDAAAELTLRPGLRLDLGKTLGQALSPDSNLVRAISAIESGAKPVRIVAFNKSEGTNWGVPWHQDRVVSVAARHEVEGFENWTQKSGRWHCEAPTEVLDRMLFVRVHLDDTNLENGAMQIAVGSHKRGTIKSAKAKEIAAQHPIEVCEAKRGDVLILKMLTLHSSRPSSFPSDRRVFRIDFASFELPEPLVWE